ncbi:MAG: isocitrate lyase/phosphoenolpyruvate mutase family protein [Pseudomonadota bacterium]
MNTPTTTAQAAKAIAFRNLHQAGARLLLANPWDAGSARLLEMEGFDALATTSAGTAFFRGQADGTLSRRVTIEQLRAICGATHLPVSADLENGYGEAPAFVAETIRMSAIAGAVGASIEDTTGDPAQPLHPVEAAADRIRAAVEAARSLPFPFVLTGRCENLLVGDAGLAHTIARLQAYQEAGADVLFAPGVRLPQDVRSILREIDRPLNVMVGFAGAPHPHELFALGVARVSVGGSLARAALGELRRAARELREHAQTRYAEQAIPNKELQQLFAQPRDGAGS